MLRDLLLKAGVSEKNMAGKHVEFIGVEDLPNKVGPGPFKDEPWGKLGKSQLLLYTCMHARCTCPSRFFKCSIFE
jgi:hypothetical protein